MLYSAKANSSKLPTVRRSVNMARTTPGLRASRNRKNRPPPSRTRMNVTRAGGAPPAVVRNCTLVPEMPHRAPPSKVKAMPSHILRRSFCIA